MGGDSWRRRLGGGLLLWLVLSAAEVALIGKFDIEETPLGIAIALAASIATVGAAEAAGVRYRLRWSWLWLALLVARNIVRDTFVVFGVVLRGLAGAEVQDAYQDVPFNAGDEHDPTDAARCALVVAGVSTSPNEIALALDRDRGSLRVHVLAVTGGKKHSTAWPL